MYSTIVYSGYCIDLDVLTFTLVRGMDKGPSPLQETYCRLLIINVYNNINTVSVTCRLCSSPANKRTVQDLFYFFIIT